MAATAEASGDGVGLDYLIGRVRYELAEVATADDGTLLMFPEWIMRQFVKMQILVELDLLDAEAMAAYEVQKAAGGPAEQEAASGPYNAAPDRLIGENGLASTVEEVFAAVTTTDPSVFE
jgi:hypothetical protein